MRVFILLVLLTSAVGEFAPQAPHARRLTIPEAIEQAKPLVPRWGSRLRELAPRPFEQAVAESDFIVAATLQSLGSYLSADKTDIYTDYRIIASDSIARRAARGGNTSPTALILRQWGGHVVVNDVPVDFIDDNMPMLPTDVPLLLLLTFNPTVGKFEVFDAIAGAFEIQRDGRLRHLSMPTVQYYERFNGMAFGQAVREIHSLGR
jgi:hypothetical protein